MKVTFSVLILVSIVLIGCSSTKTQIQTNDPAAKNIAPGEFRALAHVVKIDSTLSGGPKSDPCSKFPCTAWIKIDKIIGYGAGTGALNANDTLKTKFAFTLAPTSKEIFPTLRDPLPGLNVGSMFEADIQLLPSYPSIKNKEKLYLIYGYEKLK